MNDDDLDAWCARIAAEKAKRDAHQRELAAQRELKKTNAAAWKFIRRAVAQATEPVAEPKNKPHAEKADPITSDALARRLHCAPAKLRAVVDAVLKAHRC